MGICLSAGARRLVGLTVAGGTLLVGGAASATASAATLGVNQACYVLSGKTAPPMVVSGAGYTPADSVLITSSDGSVDVQTPADAGGNILALTQAPSPFFSAPGAKTVTLTADDESLSGPITAGTPVNVAPLAVLHGGTRKRPGLRAFTEKTSWSFSGFRPGRFIYGHYTIKSHQVARAKFGHATGPCGVLKVRAKLFPATPHHRSYPIQVDDSKRYSRHSRPRITGRLGLTIVP